MNVNTIGANVPPPIPPVRPAYPEPLGDLPEDRVPITNGILAIESILRNPRRVMYQLRQPGAGGLVLMMAFTAVACSLVYGLVVGSFSMGEQIWLAPLKIAVGLLITGVICLPSLYIFTCLSGSQARLVEVCGLVAGLLMLMTLLLIGFAPVAWLFSQSTESLVWMGVLHLVFWFISTLFGLRFLQAGFSHTQARSGAGLATWTVIFVLVAVQMTTALRPLIGTADTRLPTEKKFFLSHWADCMKQGSHSARD